MCIRDSIWAGGDRRRETVPAFTERVNVKDTGVDAEWEIDVPAGATGAGLVNDGWNVYQFKQREVTAGRGRSDVIARLKSDLDGALKALVAANDGRTPARYT